MQEHTHKTTEALLNIHCCVLKNSFSLNWTLLLYKQVCFQLILTTAPSTTLSATMAASPRGFGPPAASVIALGVFNVPIAETIRLTSAGRLAGNCTTRFLLPATTKCDVICVDVTTLQITNNVLDVRFSPSLMASQVCNEPSPSNNWSMYFGPSWHKCCP